MKVICKAFMCLAAIPALINICFASETAKNDFQIIRDNDAIIKSVHARNGLIMGIPPYWGRETTRTGFEQFAKHIGRVLKTETSLIVLKDYKIATKRALAGQIDIGFYGPTLYLNTKEVYPGLRYVATATWKETDKYVYYSYLISRKESGLRSIASLKGKSFAFGTKESTSGYMYPRAWMKKNKLNPQEYFSSVRFLKSHNKVIDAIITGEIDVGTVSPGTLKKAEKKHGDVFNRIRKFGPIPASVLAVNEKMPIETVNNIIKALNSLPGAVTDVEQFDYSGFKILSDSAYDQMRKVIQIVRECE